MKLSCDTKLFCLFIYHPFAAICDSVIIPDTVISLMVRTFLNDCANVITIKGFVPVFFSYRILQSCCYTKWHSHKETRKSIALKSLFVVAMLWFGFVCIEHKVVGDHEVSYCFCLCLEHTSCVLALQKWRSDHKFWYRLWLYGNIYVSV